MSSFSVKVERWSLLCLKSDLRQKFDCGKRGLGLRIMCPQSLLGRLSSEDEGDIILL